MKKQDISENQVNFVYLSLGSNLGNKKNNIEKAKFLLNSSGINILKTSNYYKTKSWPNNNFPDFLNIVLFAKTKNNFEEIFTRIKNIEEIIGRKKAPKNYPRICDIDIIDFNGLCISEEANKNKIIVPHINMHKRNFVLMPLYEINKYWIHPKFKKNILKLISNLSISDLTAIKFI